MIMFKDDEQRNSLAGLNDGSALESKGVGDWDCDVGGGRGGSGGVFEHDEQFNMQEMEFCSR